MRIPPEASDGSTRERSCPSGQPDMPGARVFGIVTGTEAAPEVTWLEKPVPVTPELLAKTGTVEPQRVFRIAVTCQENRCLHFDGTNCRLARRVATMMAPVDTGLPPCQLRSTCRWFGQEGRAACLRCPQVITHNYDPSMLVMEVATPE